MATACFGALGGLAGIICLSRQLGVCATGSDEVPSPLTQREPRLVHRPPQNAFESFEIMCEAFRWAYHDTLRKWRKPYLAVALMLLYRRHALSSPNLTSGSPVAKGDEWRPKLQRLIRYTCFCRSLNHARNVEQIIVRSKTMGTEVREKDILASQVRAGILRPAYAVLRDEKQKQVVLIVRGTHSMRDTLTCLTGASHPVPHHGFVETCSAGGSEAQLVLGYAHGGMLAGARWLFNEVREVLKTALQDNAGFDLRVVGHSLGGGVSVMLTMMLRELPDFREAQCITFACPACLTLELARSCQHYVTTVINGEDVVPMVSTGPAAPAQPLTPSLHRSSTLFPHWLWSFDCIVAPAPPGDSAESARFHCIVA
ncbi:hypothetical protein CYMTET_30675 [Cymbomonas tetramitiformis]|uniref:Fungal lipase-type domain-containing protein n=1 Tax=Cymbomonas tetramitiformis TaxID=36881 RepID=A0AAE0FIL3_9CHLO|nr:hypothetical protein CYMTET_30675 [Cymbomonas tetramitiformis]